MVKCKSCGLLHSSMLRCEVAKRLLGKAEDLRAGEICESPVVKTVPKAEARKEEKQQSPPKAAGRLPRVKAVFDGSPVVVAPSVSSAPFDRKAYQREYMKKYMAEYRKRKKGVESS